MGEAADNLSNQRGGLDEALSEKFNVTNGMERRFLEGDPQVIENFRTAGGCFIPNFLEPWLANQMNSFMAIECPSDWWSYCTAETIGTGDKARVQNREVFQIFAENKGERDAMYHGALKDFKDKKFAFSYSRQQGNYKGLWKFHKEGCDCFICTQNTTGIFRPDGEFEAAISKIVGSPHKISTIQWTRFSAGDFLAPHTDKGNGNIAFSLYLTKDWHPMWGGNLTFISPEGYISDTVPSQFNSLVLFDVGKSDAMHAVSPVINNIQQSRYAITGWLRAA
tara:strand:+ start:5377 stop:6213 length:837 start_codon:yes stop_codon:yes gene_type:complete